jgi:FkbM family methyltransferase
MSLSFFEKFKILLKAIDVLSNWYYFPMVYFGIIKNDHVYFSTRTGLKIKLRTNSTDLDTFTLIWLQKEYSKLGFEIHDNDIIIDVGSHIGLFALYASQFCKKGKIFCFEPNQENYDLLLSNMRLNNMANITSYNAAVSNSDMDVMLYLNADNTAHSLHIPNSKSVKVKSLTLRSILDSNKLETCDYLKLDCEGSEYDIIESLPDEYFKKIKKIYIEYHFFDTKPELVSKLLKRLESLSYSITTLPMPFGMGSIYAKQKIM